MDSEYDLFLFIFDDDFFLLKRRVKNESFVIILGMFVDVVVVIICEK